MILASFPTVISVAEPIALMRSPSIRTTSPSRDPSLTPSNTLAGRRRIGDEAAGEALCADAGTIAVSPSNDVRTKRRMTERWGSVRDPRRLKARLEIAVLRYVALPDACIGLRIAIAWHQSASHRHGAHCIPESSSTLRRLAERLPTPPVGTVAQPADARERRQLATCNEGTAGIAEDSAATAASFAGTDDAVSFTRSDYSSLARLAARTGNPGGRLGGEPTSGIAGTPPATMNAMTSALLASTGNTTCDGKR